MTAEEIKNGVLTVELWAPEMQRNLIEESVMKDCVNTKFEGQLKQKGDTVHFQYPTGVTVGDYSDGTDLAYEDLKAEDFELKIDQQKAFAFKVPDIAKVQAQVEIARPYMDEVVKELANIKDKFILSKSADVPTSNIVPTVAITKDNVYKVFVDLAKLLRKSNALNAKRKDRSGKNGYVIINPDVEAVLLQSEQFIHATNTGDKVIREGAIGQIAGLDVIVTNNNEADNSGNITILAGTTEAITYADQITKTETMRDRNSFADLVRGLYVYGGKTMLPKALAKCVVTVA